MLGRFLNLNKMKLKDFQITWANILYKCLNWKILHF